MSLAFSGAFLEGLVSIGTPCVRVISAASLLSDDTNNQNPDTGKKCCGGASPSCKGCSNCQSS